jgi:hypothetical protein
VGKTQVTLFGTNAWRAFRNVSGALSELALPALVENGVTNFNNTANGVDEAGRVAGATDTAIYRGGIYVRETRAAIWWSDENTPTLLGTIFPEGWGSGNNSPGRSEALAVSTSGAKSTVVGTGWLTPTGYARAWVLNATKEPGKSAAIEYVVNLNDPHMSWIPAGWIAVTAEDINAGGWVVGTATLGGYNHGYVLKPQPTVAVP